MTSVCVLAFISHVFHLTTRGLETAPDHDHVADRASVHSPLEFHPYKPPSEPECNVLVSLNAQKN